MSVDGVRSHQIARGGFGLNGSPEQSFLLLSSQVHKTEGPLGQGLGKGERGYMEAPGSLFQCFVFSLISDKMFPALGFGAQLPPDWKVSEAGLFPLG